ncbi:MAG: hypothetical protein SH857_03610 [Chitinophagales bacterium]|nr:hypothetical protein [Chitinophagales bacterium]
MKDTTEEAEKMQLEIILSKTNEERFLMGIEMIDSVRLIVANSIREKHPGISETELKVEMFKRYYENDFSPKQLADIIRWMRSNGK